MAFPNHGFKACFTVQVRLDIIRQFDGDESANFSSLIVKIPAGEVRFFPILNFYCVHPILPTF